MQLAWDNQWKPLTNTVNSGPIKMQRLLMSKKKSWTARPLKMVPIVCPETAVTKYQWTLRNIPEE